MKWFLACCVMAALACASELNAPSIDSVSPDSWRAGVVTEVVIGGQGFFSRARADVIDDRGTAVNQQFTAYANEDSLLDVRWIDNHTLHATAPADLAPGPYELTVITPSSESATLNNAFRIEDTRVEALRQGTATISAEGNTTVVDLAAPVDPSQSILFFSMTHDSIDPGTGHISAELSDAGDQVRFFRYDMATAIDVSLEFSVLQLAGIDVRRGTLNLSQAEDHTVGVTLDPPIRDLSHAFATMSFHTGGSSYNANDWARIRIADANTLEPYWPNGGCCDGEVRWQLIEINDDRDGRVQADDLVLAQTDLSVCTALEPVALEQSFLLFSHVMLDSGGGTAIGSHAIAGFLSADTEVCFERGRAGTAIEISYFVVSLAGMRAQHGIAQLATDDTSIEVVLTDAVDPEHAVAFLPGQMREGQTTYDGSDDRTGLVWHTVRLTDHGASLTLTRGGTGAPASVPWTVIEL